MLHQEQENPPKMKNWGNKRKYTRSAALCGPKRIKKRQKSDIILERHSTHKYSTSSNNKRVKHVTTFKNAPKCFQVDTTEKIKHTWLQKDFLVYTTKVKQQNWNHGKTHQLIN